ncbi:hypothetical protein FSPOR_3389 [Fusarium sporotrichioides]|uniref:DUF6536 domain-containing protein n=1 Tax=Fusarium sporotrichioides TaxID=5514 RepID=A0A395SGB6_FUSSP|nr:hypothetical protein FSPOR_3389 [Fusarium sporotrichioides]
MLFVSLFAFDRDVPSGTISVTLAKVDGEFRVVYNKSGATNEPTNELYTLFSDVDALGQTTLYKGDCDVSSRANLWIHLAINIIGTGVLASSNFFMQTLAAPTRKEVDAAHKAGHWLEIGVQSFKNIRFLGWKKILFWSLFSLSSIPLLLFFNGCIIESKGINDFTMMLGAESLAHGSWQGQHPVTEAVLQLPRWNRYSVFNELMYILEPINDSIAINHTQASWQRISFQDCMKRYNDPEKSATQWRHLIMVMYNYEDDWRNSTNGWKLSEVYKNSTNMNDTSIVNPLWAVSEFIGSATNNKYASKTFTSDYEVVSRPNDSPFQGHYRTVEGPSVWMAGKWDMLGTLNSFDTTAGTLILDPKVYKNEYRVMQVDHCWSENFKAPCRLDVSNILLLIVCIMCVVKCILCVLVLRLRVWGDGDPPLMTPGDAIASFISKPDKETEGMCTLTWKDLASPPGDSTQGFKWLKGPRQWRTPSSRKFGTAVPRKIWIISYLLIGSSLVVAATMLGLSLGDQSLSESRFGHSQSNASFNDKIFRGRGLLQLTMVANFPQVVLSLCYLAYNGLFTRMLAELEWSKRSIEFRALRVTEPKVYRARYPYDGYVEVGLAYSSRAVLVTFITSVCVAIVPIFLANIRLPGMTVVSGGNSAVISAACHYPSKRLQSPSLSGNDLLTTLRKREPRGDLALDISVYSTGDNEHWFKYLSLRSETNPGKCLSRHREEQGATLMNDPAHGWVTEKQILTPNLRAIAVAFDEKWATRH